MITIQQMTFSSFLEEKFLEWQRKNGRRSTVAEFAKWIGVKPSSISMWWNNSNEPSEESIRLLADKLGIEVYDALGLPRPNEDLYAINKIWDDLPPAAHRSLREQAEAYKAENELQQVRKTRTTRKTD